MILEQLLQPQEILNAQGDLSCEITDIVFDTDQVREGCCFVCLIGKRQDGHRYADLAVASGARAVVCMREYANPDATVVRVADTRKTLGRMAARRYGNPADRLRIIGVVGTNGKSTVAYLIRNILQTAGRNAALLGTMYYEYADKRLPSELTTPDPVRLHELFSDMVRSGVQDVVMEVSAHAIALQKLDGIVADCCVFTNFSQDHLDYFETMDAYRRCKTSFFTPQHTRKAVVNADDEVGRQLLRDAKVPSLSYGLDNPADVFAVDVRQTAHGARFVVNLSDEIFEVRSNLYGKFNVSNMLAACGAASALGVSAEDICRSLDNAVPPAGRFNVVHDKGVTYVVDFAHTPDGLYNLLKESRALTRGKVITIFGCGGDRDVSKRPIMGKIAGEMSDIVIVTTDNPRTESREAIASDIVAGIRLKGKLYVELDRAQALALGAKLATSGDVVLIAGKGSENYIDENHHKIPYSDMAQLLRVVGRCE